MKSLIMSVNTSGQYTIYTLPRKFRSDAKLHPFLAMKTPDMIKANKVEYTLFTVSIILFPSQNGGNLGCLRRILRHCVISKAL